MEVSHVSDPFEVQSHKGPYTVEFTKKFPQVQKDCHYIIDNEVAKIYGEELDSILTSRSVLRIKATEDNKTLDKFTDYVLYLTDRKIRRNHTLVAIGGGIIQDITCFLSATLLRGIPWIFHPTTLLAQADSCIGSKSSINVGVTKNILGTFTPPHSVFINIFFVNTLSGREFSSGVGEILKVHAIKGPAHFDSLSEEYYSLFTGELLEKYLYDSLQIKKKFIERDEFDLKSRRVLNYGHSFGHALESATNFAIPHGIAVTIGMDMANYIAMKLELTTEEHYKRMHETLKKNFYKLHLTDIPVEAFLTALSKDKKNSTNQVKLVLPNKKGEIIVKSLQSVPKTHCETYLQELKNV